MVSQLKGILYSRKTESTSLRKVESHILREYKESDFSQLLETAYLIARITREKGGILDSDCGLALLGRLNDLSYRASRQDTIRLIQVCSTLGNRNKAQAGDGTTQEIIVLRDALIDRSFASLSGRLEDLPSASLSLLISSLARQYKPLFEKFFHEVADEVSRRAEQGATSSAFTHPSSILRLGDLERLVSYVYLAFAQASVETPSSLNDSCLNFLTCHTDKIQYAHICQFIEAFRSCTRDASRNDRFLLLIDYMRKAVSSHESRENLQLMDFVRLVKGFPSEDLFRDALIQEAKKRDREEFTIHALRDMAGILSKMEKIDRNFELIFFNNLTRELPPKYLVDILCTLDAAPMVRRDLIAKFVKNLVRPNLQRISQDDRKRLEKTSFFSV